MSDTGASAAEQSRLVQRLAGLGRLWGHVKFFHPDLAYESIDWDAALLSVVPEVIAARTPEEFGWWPSPG